jgi:molybdenum cofactor cytidylyltransferase
LRKTLALAAGFAPAKLIVVVPRGSARYRIEARGLRVIFADNPRRADGLSSSVRRGIALARYSPALLLLPVDLAGLRHRDMARLISCWRAARRCVIARRIDERGGRAHGVVPLILPRRLYARALGVTGDIGLRELVGQLPKSQRVLLDLPSAALDVDTPRDLRAARRRAQRSAVSP